MAKVNLNERSWAIDVITEINLIVRKKNRNIKHAGGERTVKASKQSNSLFPDILLFQDEDNIKVLQGWELKMPDTPLEDKELLENAAKKAHILALNSFLVWNFSKAALYSTHNGSYTLIKQWDDLQDIKTRSEVDASKTRWKKQLEIIIDDLEEYFIKGVIKSQNILESLTENNIIDVITGNISLVKANIVEQRKKNSVLDAEISEWWDNIKIEYSSEPDANSAVSKLALITWVNRILFTHYLKKFTNKAKEIDAFTEDTSLEEAKVFFTEFTAKNDFFNVYAPVIGEEAIDKTSWQQVMQLSIFLSELKLEQIDQGILQQFFEHLLLSSKRKTAGQYATPYPLGRLMAKVVMHDKTKSVLDPFCGTGTILRAVYDLKEEFGVPSKDLLANIWGSDKFSFPLHMTTMALAKPSSVGEVINIFKSDVKDLSIGKSYDFIEPNTGKLIHKKLPAFDYIMSNLPFIESSNIEKSNPKIKEILEKIKVWLKDKKIKIGSKSDIIAYLPYYLWELLADQGTLGLIVSNSWLGTSWGYDFRQLLSRFFRISHVITSGEGIWFNNAKIVTNILILEKRKSPVEVPGNDELTNFVLVKPTIKQLENKDVLDKVTNQIILKKGTYIKYTSLSYSSILANQNMGVGWPALFTDISWLNALKSKLIKASTLFDINRGERRGWDPLFMPEEDNTIEEEFLQPVLKNLKDTHGLVSRPDGTAFCCSYSLDELKTKGATGAIKWINKFEKQVNGIGKPLTTVLAKSGLRWFEMKSDTVADLVAMVNYGNALKVVRMTSRAFVNQRLIRLTAKKSTTDINLMHALMNSQISLFYIEAMGFGRGMGALDLNSTKFKESYFVLNPALLSKSEKAKIIKAFAPLTKRKIYDLDKELEQPDRIHFEKIVEEAFKFEGIGNRIKLALLELYHTRTSVK